MSNLKKGARKSDSNAFKHNNPPPAQQETIIPGTSNKNPPVAPIQTITGGASIKNPITDTSNEGASNASFSSTTSEKVKKESKVESQKHEHITEDESADTVSIYTIVYDYILNFLRRVFTFPLRNPPISFYRSSEFNSRGKYIGEKQDDTDEREGKLEALLNYDTDSKQLFEEMLRRRKMNLRNSSKVNDETIDLKKFPLWNEETINYLRTTFKTFDTSQEGLLSLENWNDKLFDFGDQSSENEREMQFYRVSNGEYFIDFPQFLDLLYAATMNDHKSTQTDLLAVGIRTANYNISRMKNLDLVQRMQVGMF